LAYVVVVAAVEEASLALVVSNTFLVVAGTVALARPVALVIAIAE
jgi:hypothetical protein